MYIFSISLLMVPEILPDAESARLQALKEEEAEKTDLTGECLRDDPVKEIAEQQICPGIGCISH